MFAKVRQSPTSTSARFSADHLRRYRSGWISLFCAAGCGNLRPRTLTDGRYYRFDRVWLLAATVYSVRPPTLTLLLLSVISHPLWGRNMASAITSVTAPTTITGDAWLNSGTAACVIEPLDGWVASFPSSHRKTTGQQTAETWRQT